MRRCASRTRMSLRRCERGWEGNAQVHRPDIQLQRDKIFKSKDRRFGHGNRGEAHDRRGQRDRRMPREQVQQLLTGIAGGPGDRDPRQRGSGDLRGQRSRLQKCMHEKEYLYTRSAIRSTEIDV